MHHKWKPDTDGLNNFSAVNLQDIETQAVSKWRDISSNIIAF